MLRSKISKSLFASFLLLFVAAPAICFLQNKNLSTLPVESNISSAAVVPFEKAPLNKNAGIFVKKYIKDNQEDLITIKKRSKMPFAIMDAVFKSYNLPLELKYLSVIESELKSTAVSPVGAVGPWQLMPETASLMGLKVTPGGYDERKQFRKSTKAAAIYLKDLYGQFGDWLLVMAAYNAGPGVVYKAIQKSGSRNFWKLQGFLPAESRMHVKRFIATQYYFEGQGSITTLTKEEGIRYNLAKTKWLAKQQAAKSNPSIVLASYNPQDSIKNSIAGRF